MPDDQLNATERAREAWFGMIQEYLECRIQDAPDETCRTFARNLWNQTAQFTDE
jgi:hypothetical protein